MQWVKHLKKFLVHPAGTTLAGLRVRQSFICLALQKPSTSILATHRLIVCLLLSQSYSFGLSKNPILSRLAVYCEDAFLGERELTGESTFQILQVQGYKIDYEDWHHDVHGSLPYQDLIHKDPELRQILQSLPYPKFIFTNADIKHAQTVLGILGIDDLFEVRLLPLPEPLMIHR